MSLKYKAAPSFARSLTAVAASTLLAGLAFAQDASMERVEVTGSAIKRIDAETAMPVTVIKVDELRNMGLTSVEDILGLVSGNQSLQGTSQSVGASTGGASFANMRGLGQNKTLVLLNGRRIANNAIDSSAPDLNMIPMAALERVEVLRDGASALYGTDAIGGVINFITRKNFTGGTVSIDMSKPQHAGGDSKGFNIGYGVGDLGKDKFNVFGFLDYQKQNPLSASQRPQSTPGQGFYDNKTSSTPYPGIYSQGGAKYSPFAPSCNQQYLTPSGTTSCAYLYANWVDLIPKTDRVSGMLKGTFNISANQQLDVEYFATKATTDTRIAPVPYAALTMDPGTPFYPGNGITPAAPAGAINPTNAISVRWRDVANGPRADSNPNLQQRFVISLKGSADVWDYDTGFSYNQNTITDNLIGGYTNGTVITNGIKTGVINPFSTTQTAAGTALLQSANAFGTLFNAKASTTVLDAHASRELADWFTAGRAASLAVGAEVRNEKSQQIGNPAYDTLVIASTGFDPATSNVGSRNIFAAFGELNVPFSKTFEATVAARYDHYSDFGSTFNPKLSARWQPNDMFLVRGSAMTGFRAPSIYDLNQSQVYTLTANNWNDPVLCPNGVPVKGANVSAACNNQFMALAGGNKNLKPETSKSATLGFVFQPTKEFDIGLDLWWINLANSIGALSDNTIFSNPTKYASYFHRAPDGTLSYDGSQCPGSNCGYVSLQSANLGGVSTSGIDFSSSYKAAFANGSNLTLRAVGTVVTKYLYQNEPGGDWQQNVGVYSGTGPIFRLQSTLSATYRIDGLTLGLANHFKSSYADQSLDREVSPYITWDTFGSYAFDKSTSVTFGVRNLFDKAPPFSNQTATFQVGYDPRFADPFMRTFYARGTYRF